MESTFQEMAELWLGNIRCRDEGNHTTRCIESGVDIKALSEILGHASVNITLNRYVHSSPEMKRRNMEKVRPLCRSDKVTEEVSPILAD